VVQEVGGVPPLVGNPAELREVLLNLVFNAIEAMPEGGTLTLSSWAEGGNVWLAVKDTGVGIPEEIRSRIFDPFFTTKGVQSSGLGLSVSYGIIHRHGGEIMVESRPGRGTTFTIRLPRREAPAPQREVAPSPAAAGLRVLVVDDEEDVREALRDLLQAVGHEVYEAGSGPQGLEVLGAQEVELVCTDLGMPGMTGWEVAERVKARWPDLAVALITGWGAGIDPEELKAHGVDFLITKPFEMDEIQRVLSEVGRFIGVGR
jgi:CheY-like chemotaxis protein